MTQFNALLTKLRINSLLSCSAVVLLAACGGDIDPGAEQLSVSAAGVSTDAGAVTGANIPASIQQ